MRLENWYVKKGNNPYLAPEVDFVLCGKVFGHPRIQDGTNIRTSRPIKTIDNKVYTTNGNIYELGVISPEYEKWCIENNFPTQVLIKNESVV